jgi:type IV secretion system protein TrbI
MAQKNMGNDAAPVGTPSTMQPNGTAAPMGPGSQPTAPPSDPVADAEKALAFKSRFASNLVSAEDGARSRRTMLFHPRVSAHSARQPL